MTQQVKVGNRVFVFDESVKYELYKNESYYGVIFILENEGDGYLRKDARYDIVHHYHMDWERLLVNNKEGWKDLPLNQGTYKFLPDKIKVIEL